MKKINTKKVILIIILLLFIVFQIVTFRKSMGEKTIDIVAYIVDNSNTIENQQITINATDEGESGVSITLPEIINTRKVTKYIIEKSGINKVENVIVDNSTETDNIETQELKPGEKLFLTREELENLQITLLVEYDTIDVNGKKLYNKKIIISDENNTELITVIGYMPDDIQIEVNEIDMSNINQDEITENFHSSDIIGNYKINLISEEKEYIPYEYEQNIEIQISNIDKNNTIDVFKIEDNQITKIEDVIWIEEKISFKQDKITSYIIVKRNEETNVMNNIELFIVEGDNTKLNINDYEADKNYYLGLNYTENNAKQYTGEYTENNLKEVEINYYGYNYDITEFVIPEEHEVSLSATASRTQIGNVSQSGNWGNRTYSRTDTISVTVSGINELRNQYPDFLANSNWEMQINVPNNNFSNYFYEEGTTTANEGLGITASINNDMIVVSGANASGMENANDTWTFTFYITFRSNNTNNINNINYTTLSVNSFQTTISIGEYTPYGTISDTETQTVISYKKCIPVDSNGNITIELIDNPFMNRPIKKGFNGWTTNDTRYLYDITTNMNTYIQTLTTNINNIIDNSGKYVINLYADWVDANVVFVSSQGNSSNTGYSLDSPIDNNWDSISSKLNSNAKTCTNASNREVNIVVLMYGTLNASGLADPNTPYTLTSLYNGIDYGNNNTYLNVGSTNTYLDSDFQIHDMYVSSSSSYTSPRGTTDGTSAISPCIYGNMYNLRIGRQIVSINNNCTWAQVQGGYYDHSSNEYKLVIESGQYLTMQLYRASTSQSTTANATMVVGNDIDRNNNNNDTLKIYNRMASRTTSATCNPYTANDPDAKVINMIIKSGTIGIDYFNNASTADDSDRNYAGIYVGGHGNTGTDKSDRYILIEGGNIANLIGGLNVSENDMYKTYMYIKDGNILNITGGAGYTHTYGDRIIQITGGYVKYSISGGSNGVAASSDSNNGQLTGKSLIYVGGTAQIGASSTIDQNGNEIVSVTDTNEVLYGVNAGSVCGGANGNNEYAGQTDGSYIIIDGNAIVHNNVFGGGNYGIIGSEDNGQLQPGKIEYINESANFTTNKEYYIGTSNYGINGLSISNNSLANELLSTQTVPSDISKWIFESAGGNEYYIKNSNTNQYLYLESFQGGSWLNSTCIATVELSQNNKTAFTINGSNSKTITYKYTTSGFFGRTNTLYLGYYDNGSWGVATNTDINSVYLLTYIENEETEVNDLDTLVNIEILGGTVKNNVYGGANQNNIYGTVEIDVKSGKVDSIIYGGSNIRGTITGSVLMDITGGQLGNNSNGNVESDVLFGGGLGQETNVNGRVLININETDNNLHIYGNVYGGSSLGKISNNITINIQDLPATLNNVIIIGNVFGGGKGESDIPAEVIGDININVDGSYLENCSVFGGSNINGNINGNIILKIGENYETIINSVYGGGNQARIDTQTNSVYVYLLENSNVTDAFNGGKSADFISSGEDDTTRAIYLQGGIVENIYGGSNISGTVTTSHVYIEYGTAENVYGGNNQGGTVQSTHIEVIDGNINNIYGGNNQGGIAETTNLFINGGTILNAYGGGDNANANVSNISATTGTIKNLYGGGNQAQISTNTNVDVNGAIIQENVYGGGNEGTVIGNTNVHIKNSTINGSVYSGGNGSNATVYGNTNLNIDGKNTNIIKNVFGGGNKAATGDSSSNSSESKVNIVGANIGGNVYGGANTSVVYGTTKMNIGYDAVNNSSLEIGDVNIAGTVFGGGEANESGDENYDFSFISVTEGIEILIDGNKHENFAIRGSIFGSGNASSTSGQSYITIKNYGTIDNPQFNISIQRANLATIINSAISLSGATDRTNEYSSTYFSISRVDEVKLKNNSTLYLQNGANLLKKLDSVVDDENGNEVKGSATINPDTGETIKNVDNRIYMLEGKNLNIATNEQVTTYGEVYGMFFFGLFSSKNNPSTSTGFYNHEYNNGDTITNEGTFLSNSYVMGQHLLNHDITIDGFYTNYNEEGIIRTNYITPTPDADVYYIWTVGEQMDVKVFNVELTASKYITLGTYELLLQGYSTPNIKYIITGISLGLENGISLVNPSEINPIEQDEEKANNILGLTMETGNNGWETNGLTTFLTEDGGKYTGTTNYNKDNSTYTPTLNLCLYHSQNITEKRNLGDIRIRIQVLTPIDDLNYEISWIDIVINIASNLFQDDFYEGAITPGQKFGLFTSTDTTISSKSDFSIYFSHALENFDESQYYNAYQTSNRVLVSVDSNGNPYVLPENTKITMLDLVTNTYYYYIVSNEDILTNKYTYRLKDFISMGSTDKQYDEETENQKYYLQDQNMLYENFIFHVNFSDTNLTENIQSNSLLMELRNDENATLVGVLGIQRDILRYSVYGNQNAIIQLDGNINPEVVYLGQTINLNVSTTFTQTIVDSKKVYDTQYFDKKLGIKISIYDIDGNKLNLDSLLGINFEIDGQKYYPRVDGTTRIKIADKVTDVLAKIKINTEDNTTWATGDYKIVIESFGSSDGIYYGLTASDSIELNVTIINLSYGLKVITNDNAKIVDKETGNTVDGTNSLVSTVEYSSVFNNPNITVSLYRRTYDNIYSSEYEKVDLQEYVLNTLSATDNEMEYVAFNNPNNAQNYFLRFKPELITGTYKLVYKLYDGENYIGEDYEYIIIK